MGYTVIGSTKSRAMRVLWMLEELGLDYDHRPAAPRSDDVRRLNPSGKIPVLLDDEDAITDSTAILTYLADKHGALSFPAATLDRARQDGLTQMILDEVDALLWTAARHSFILPEDRRVPAVKESLKWEFSQSEMRIADRLGDRPFLMGPTMTIPDIILGHCGGWAVTAKFPVEDARLRAYIDRLRARPAFQRAAAR